jgi:hypothetical protein
MAISEVEAISVIDGALGELEEEEAARVLRWASEKYGQALPPAPDPVANPTAPVEPMTAPAAFEDIADLMAAIDPRNGVERVLVATYWFQVINGHPSVTGQQVNESLRNLGHAASNITDAFTSLIRRKPQLAIQVEKTGSSKQARKKYKLTVAGIDQVKKLLASKEED